MSVIFPLKISIDKATIDNECYRKVIYTTKESQVVLMSLPVGDYIRCEKHGDVTQFIKVEGGTGVVYINGDRRYNIKSGDSVVIPSNTYHYIKNTGKDSLKLYSIYSPPEHPDNLVQLKNPDN